MSKSNHSSPVTRHQASCPLRRAPTLRAHGRNEGSPALPKSRTGIMTPLAAAFSMALLPAAGAFAQDDGSDEPEVLMDEIEEIVVSAKFQRSLASAIDQKRRAATQIEAIGLEDIGVLPAVSIADAIATLPGVAGARSDDGNIGLLSVRGTTDLALGLLNGREQVTVTSTRNVEYGLYPPNVMTSVQVHKTPMASLPEGGLSGVINMNTIRPLDFDERTITLNAEASHYPLADDVIGGDSSGGQGSITFIDQLSDSFGFALSAAFAQELVGRDGDVTPFEWQAFSGGFGAPADVDGDGNFSEEVVPAGFNLEAVGGDEQRASFFAALQWESDEFEVNFDLLASQRERDTSTYGLNFIGTTGASGTLVNPVVNLREGFTTDAGVTLEEYAAATITVPGTNASGFGSGGSSSYNQITTVDEDILSTGVNLRWNKGLWTFEGDLSLSQAEWDSDIVDGTTHLAPTGGFGGPTLTLSYSALGDSPALAVQENLLDPSIWVPRQLENIRRTNEDQLTGVRFGASRELNATGLTDVSFGLRYTEREKDFELLANRFNSAFVPDDATLVLTDSFVRGVVTPDNGPAYIAWDLDQLRTRFAQMMLQADAALPAPLARNTLLAETGSVEEENLSAFVQLNFDTIWGSVPVSGNLGLRYVSTDLVAPGWTTPARETVPAARIRPEHDYDEILPSANIAFDLLENHKLRFGVSRVLNRPPLDDMRSSEAIFISGFGANGTAGNPMLDPTVADQASLSYEWYPSVTSSVVVAAYYADLDTFIGTEFVTRPVVDVGGNEVDVTFQVPGNGDGGYIRGAEVSANTSFGFIHEALDSFGASFNYAYTSSNVLPVAAGGEGVALTGLSKDVANLALWWVGGSFEARVGLDYRSEYVEPNAFGNFLHVDDTLLTSFQLSYDFSEDFRISLFGRNVGDEARRKYTFNIPDRTEFNRHYRETYGIKLFYQF